MKNRTRALAALAAVLLIGCILGIAVYRFFERGPHKMPVISSAGRVPGHAGRLSYQLQLTNEQERQLSAILEDSRREIEMRRRDWDSKLQQIRTKTNDRISSILNHEQKQKFQEILKTAGSHGGSSGGQDHGHGHE